MWHAGTLDPLATWLMLLLTDEDTKKMATLVGHDKWYTAKIDLSHISDTRDADYHDMYEAVMLDSIPTLEQISSVLQGIVPKAVLPLPSFSAKKIDGRRMYKSARQWVVHDVDKEMEIYSIDLLEYVFPYVSIRCHVGSWTFIRSIARYLWKMVWWGGIITELRREKVGDYSLDDPACIKDLLALKQS